MRGPRVLKLLDDGRTSDAVDALDLLVQRGCHVSNKLFYLALKRCIQDKDLVLGSRIHALTAKKGYDRHAFLATHLIGLYAAHRRLDDAMRVFRKVEPSPDVYNWASIILAHARHGTAPAAAEAVRLYRQMMMGPQLQSPTAVEPDDRIFSAVLKACACAGDLVAGKEVHAQIVARRRPAGKKLDAFVAAALVNMYAKCGSLEAARSVLDELRPELNIVACNAMLSGYAQGGMGEEALALYTSMKKRHGCTAFNPVTYVSLLQACASLGTGAAALEQGKQLHMEIQKRGLLQEDDAAALGGSLVNMYAKCGSLADARTVLDALPGTDVVAWTAMIAGYTRAGMGEEALRLYKRSMQQEPQGLVVPPGDSVTYVCLLQACASVGVGALEDGKQLHAQIKARRVPQTATLTGSLLNMYAKCGSVADARDVFDKLPDKGDVVKWTAMIAAYTQQGMGHEALALYESMQQECGPGTRPDCVTYVCLLQACASVGEGALELGKQLHAQIQEEEEGDVVLGGSLVNMYAKCGSSLEDARRVFDRLPDKNIVAWNAMLAGYAHKGMGQEALRLYKSMQHEDGRGILPNAVTYVSLLQACASQGVDGLLDGQQLHAQIEERGLLQEEEEDKCKVVRVSLVNMYAKCGSLHDARTVFDNLQAEGRRNQLEAWNAMMAGYTKQGAGQEVLLLYRGMQQEGLAPDFVTYVCLLQACAMVGVEALSEGEQVHARVRELGLQEDRVLGVHLVNMYAKCGSLDRARGLFDKLQEPSVVAFNAMVAGYTQQGMGEEALSLYAALRQRQDRHLMITPDCVTYVWLLQACGAVAALATGEQLHAEIVRRGLQIDGSVGAALVSMYAKCGDMRLSQRVFDSLPGGRSPETWAALVSGYANQGAAGRVFDLLDRMQRAEGVHPTASTFLSVLSVCSHAGLVDKGRDYFQALTTRTPHHGGVAPTVQHYVCMVNLLGRAGHLAEALHMVRTMPFPPTDALWHTLLSACRKWGDVDIGRQAFEGAVGVDAHDPAPYVLMSSIYAGGGMWEAAQDMQARRTRVGAWKKPGQSWWTDAHGVVHTFVVGDRGHPGSEDIYAALEQMVPKLTHLD